MHTSSFPIRHSKAEPGAGTLRPDFETLFRKFKTSPSCWVEHWRARLPCGYQVPLRLGRLSSPPLTQDYANIMSNSAKTIQWLRAAPFHGFLVPAGVGERLPLVVTVRRRSAEIALVPGFERSKLRLGRSCANRVETEETDRIEASVRVAAMSEFLRIARYFLFSHRFCLYAHKTNAINFFASNFGGMAICRQVAYKATQPINGMGSKVRMGTVPRVGHRA